MRKVDDFVDSMRPEYLDYHIEIGGAGLVMDPEKDTKLKEGGTKEPFSVLMDSDSFEEV